ncbi:MAG: allantoate amidohydrolase [Alphaproteobacteria bacterium]|nr:allantoate amidohydrolase [Alphaproteobacteria bacterium]
MTTASSSLGARAYQRLEALRAYTDEPGKITRLYLSPSHIKSIDFIVDEMRRAGCDSVSVDALGTVVGRYEGKTSGLPALLIGSHIDTVVDGGAYDGALGVIAGIGVVEALHQNGERLDFAIEVLGFGDEENVRFPANLTSSRAIAGTLDEAALDARDGQGISIREALTANGFDPSKMKSLERDPKTVIGYVEIHIEQGPILEAENLSVGVVTAINGATRWALTVKGEPGHAGTVPMNMRHDALTAASEVALAIERIGRAHESVVATVGRFQAFPGAVNVIPGEVRFSLDARAPDDALREKIITMIEAECKAIAARRHVALHIEPLSSAKATLMASHMIAGLSEAIGRRQITPRLLPSGAGHDAMAMATLCPAGMMFVRCKGGISHSPLESMTESDCDTAIEVLLDFVQQFDPKR